jgi:hypothetical protein
MEENETAKKNDGLSIIIENIEFTLIYKTMTYINGIYEAKYNLPPLKEELSLIVKIRSVNLDTRNEELFWVYLSLSELGVWRFACYNRISSQAVGWAKGKDYVQSTCINMDLQKHIHSCLDRLDEMISTPENPHVDIINVPEVLQPSFESIIDQNLNLSQEYINKHLFIINDSNREKYLFDKDKMIIKCGASLFKEENVIRQIQTTSSYLENNYVILGHEELFRYNFVFRDIINSVNIVLKVTLKNKITNEIIIVFYKKMFFSKLHSIITPSIEDLMYDKKIDLITKDGNEHNVVILVIPSTSRCLNNSLYTEYIHLGIYVCKPFEYTRTLSIKTEQCTKEYSYVGYRYENIFPIKNIDTEYRTEYKRKTKEKLNNCNTDADCEEFFGKNGTCDVEDKICYFDSNGGKKRKEKKNKTKKIKKTKKTKKIKKSKKTRKIYKNRKY